MHNGDGDDTGGPLGDSSSTRAIYDAMAELFERDAEDGAYNAHYDRPAMLELLPDVDGLTVLDAACGPGFYTEELLRRGATVTAVDVSEAMVALTRTRVGARAQVAVADLNEALPYPDGAFDLVVAPLVIHYLSDRRATFREFFRVLRPGGRAVISTQHPTTDWLRKGGSYFDTRIETDTWEREGRTFDVRFWREPLTSVCSAATDAGFLIERLVEPLPAESMRDRWPETWEKLHQRPGFLMLRLLRPPI